IMPKVITSKLGDALEGKKTIIIIMLDNFNYKYADQLIEIFNRNNYTNFKKEPILSMIPSETYINKGTLLSMNTFEVDEKPDYNSLCQNIGKMYSIDTEYLSNIGKLKESKIKKNHLYVVNYLMLDKTLHENQKQAASSLPNRIKNELEAIVQIIDDSINDTNKLETEVYIIPDHGSVKIPSSRMNLIPGFDEIDIIDDGYRSVKISDRNLKQIKKSDQDFYYIMDKNRFGVPHNYLIAKYYYRFKETNNSFYVHGGLSPEETIVPLLGFKKDNDNVEIELPNLNIKTKSIRKSVKNEIEFGLKNSNPFSLNNIKIELANSELKCPNKTKYLEAVDAFEEEKILFNKVEISNNKSTIALLVDVSFNYLNNKYDKRYKFELFIKSIQENSFDLNDLL
ncbi:MAG: PglZ domain-containing protein, partial [bacterium]